MTLHKLWCAIFGHRHLRLMSVEEGRCKWACFKCGTVFYEQEGWTKPTTAQKGKEEQ